jgi:hypothetical protein
MRRLSVLLAVLSLVLLVVPVAASAGLKVELCHVNESNETWIDSNGAPWHFGRLIEVSYHAWSKHQNHGDAWYNPGNPNWYGFHLLGDAGWDAIMDEGAAGFVKNANCAFSYGVPAP